MPKEVIEKKEGKVTVNIQREDVLASVNILASAVEALAKVLTQTPQVMITNCRISNVDTGIEVQGINKDLMRTEEEEVE